MGVSNPQEASMLGGHSFGEHPQVTGPKPLPQILKTLVIAVLLVAAAGWAAVVTMLMESSTKKMQGCLMAVLYWMLPMM